jgi:hypothetical protein
MFHHGNHLRDHLNEAMRESATSSLLSIDIGWCCGLCCDYEIQAFVPGASIDPCKYRTESQETEDILLSYPLSC